MKIKGSATVKIQTDSFTEIESMVVKVKFKEEGKLFYTTKQTIWSTTRNLLREEFLNECMILVQNKECIKEIAEGMIKQHYEQNKEIVRNDNKEMEIYKLLKDLKNIEIEMEIK